MTQSAHSPDFMTVSQIRQAFLNFFADKGHAIVPASSLIPHNDPTLLFTNSGMVQFKDVFLGQETRPYRTATSSQRSLRAGGKHNDLENVGYTARHHTFFEMLGNFSFGEYFKQQAIFYAWELLTKIYKLPAEKLWVTIYHTDDEAYAIWHETIGVPAERIIRIGDNKGALYASDNFWQMGDTGPCGPCSEIFYDHGDDVFGGPPGSPDEDGDRYIEIWNLVFMQYNRDAAGNLSPLPKPCVDTGMGLERISAVLQHVHSNYEIDLFQTLIKKIAIESHTTDIEHPSLKVIADHLRAMVFLLLEGITPGSEARAYVLRRIMRRAIRHGYKLGMREAFIYKACATLVEEMGDAYPDLLIKKDWIAEQIKQEEARFLQTLKDGMELLEKAIETAFNNAFETAENNAKNNAKNNTAILSGEVAFKLHDTFGFPLDLTADICREKQLQINEAEFELHMQAQRERARAAGAFKNQSLMLDTHAASVFQGYTHLSHPAKLLAIYDVEQQQQIQMKAELAATTLSAAFLNQAFAVVLDQTPFYAESGGQVGDIGEISFYHPSHVQKIACFKVNDTQKQGDTILHFGEFTQINLNNHLSLADLFASQTSAEVDQAYRQAVTKHHSATHLLHHVLRDILGKHVEQKGSLVKHNRLRFDFSHPEAIDETQLMQIQHAVNQMILANHAVQTKICDIEAAKASGAMALFGEKYQQDVRVLSIGASIELCGGTHVTQAAEIGQFIIETEAGVAAGVRRIEAIVGQTALSYIQNQQTQLKQIAQHLRVGVADVPEKFNQQQVAYKNLQKAYEQLKQKQLDLQLKALVPDAMKNINEQGAVVFLGETASLGLDLDVKQLKTAAETLKQYILDVLNKFTSTSTSTSTSNSTSASAVVVLFAIDDETAHVVVASNHKAYPAGDLVKTLSAKLGGKGGGRADLAQGGGQAALLPEAQLLAKSLLGI